MRKIFFRYLRKSANKKWKRVVKAQTSHEAVKLVINILAKGGDPNFVIKNGEKEGTLLDFLPVSFSEARLHIRRAGGMRLEDLKVIESEGRELAAIRAVELRQKIGAVKSAEEELRCVTIAHAQAEEGEKIAAILDEALKSFR